MEESLNILLVDAEYALRQCRKHHDPDRAGDALERIVERVKSLKDDLDAARAGAAEDRDARDAAAEAPW